MPLMIYCTAALTSFSDCISCITYLFSEWRILLSSVPFVLMNMYKVFQIDVLGLFECSVLKSREA